MTLEEKQSIILAISREGQNHGNKYTYLTLGSLVKIIIAKEEEIYKIVEVLHSISVMETTLSNGQGSLGDNDNRLRFRREKYLGESSGIFFFFFTSKPISSLPRNRN